MRAITRSKDHHYTYQGRTYPGTTGILNVLDKSGPLMHWASRMTAEAAVELAGTLTQLVEVSGREGAVKALMERRTTRNETAKQLGTEVHELADRLIRGEPLPDMTPAAASRVQLYAAWWQDRLLEGWTLRASEAMVVDTVHGYGGTLDLLVRDPDRQTHLLDIKTGNVAYRGHLYDSIVLQLVAYGGAELLESDLGLFPMPKVDRYGVVHVTEDAVELIPAPVTLPDDLEAFHHLIALDAWRSAMKARKPRD